MKFCMDVHLIPLNPLPPPIHHFQPSTISFMVNFLTPLINVCSLRESLGIHGMSQNLPRIFAKIQNLWKYRPWDSKDSKIMNWFTLRSNLFLCTGPDWKSVSLPHGLTQFSQRELRSFIDVLVRESTSRKAVQNLILVRRWTLWFCNKFDISDHSGYRVCMALSCHILLI